MILQRACLFTILLLVAAHVPSTTADWKPAAAPLLTKWAAEVTPDQQAEYPRPTMVRGESSWASLNGLWQFVSNVSDLNTPPFGKTLGEELLVPYPIESPLSGIRRTTDKDYMWMRRTFTSSCANQRTLLHFEAVDWNSTVYVDGRMLGWHAGGYDAFSFDITDILAKSKESPHELLVGVFDPTGPWPIGKQSRGAVTHPGGIRYTCTSGIWQTVWLECVPDVFISDIFNQPSFAEKSVSVTVNVSGALLGSEPAEHAAVDMTVSIIVSIRDADDALRTINGTGSPSSPVKVQIPTDLVRPWSPDSPELYNITAMLISGGKVIDTVDSYFGLRTISVTKDKNGIPRPMLNGEFIFQAGTLDQGFWPDGAYAAPNDNALAYDVQAHKDMGFNMVRKHVKVEPRRWYYHTDRLGLLVWQDMPSAGNQDDVHRQQFAHELTRLVMGRRNHPSIVQWETFNEGWGQASEDFTKSMVQLVQSLDPHRLVDDASGGHCAGAPAWTGGCSGNVTDLHHYSPPASPKVDTADGRVAVLGEFGGILSEVDKHQWAPGHCHAYTKNVDGSGLASLYTTYMSAVGQLRDSAGLCASVYTQITDVETECNGMMSYDRVMKSNATAIAAANKLATKAKVML
ncbi:beta-galactosidase-like [Sycon ciliatum]|uniref:beta-galactosidase-like n=1 Tax=Sycon ciliatum TaxID=27933 RepID=UPI0020AA2340|eukprot:scpid41061/ scgid8701/ Beta-galactosidase; Lactase